jgi:two-component system sensor histidine kinase BarA
VRRDYVNDVLAAARRRQLLVLSLFVVAGIVVASVLMAHLLKPMAALRRGIERIGQGDLDTPVVLTDRTELRLLGSAINDMAGQLKQAQQRLLRNNRDLTVANQNLKDLDRLKSEFLRNVNHELRTPLAVIIAYLSYLQERSKMTIDQAELSESIDVALSESWKLKGLLEDLLEFSAASSDSLTLDLAPGDLRAVLTTYHAERIAGVVEGKREFVFEPDENVPEAVFDQRRLLQVLDSLLDNAVKFTPQGTRITLRLGTELGGEGTRVRVLMEDNGPGVPPEHLPVLFHSFRQLDGSTTREVGGMGLGLALTKQFVEKMGGEITVRSEVGQGTVFAILLPAAWDEPIARAVGEAS